MKSIIQKDKNECFLCHRTLKLEEHHIFDGPNRKHSEQYGLKVYLCHDCHNRDLKHHSVHFDKNTMLKLHRIGEETFCIYYNKNIDDFVKIFHNNYI